jgi:hypothetical protein
VNVNAHEGVVEFLKSVEREEELRNIGSLHHVFELDKGCVVVGLEMMLELEEGARRESVCEMLGIGDILEADGEVGTKRASLKASLDETEEVVRIEPNMGRDHSEETADSCAVRAVQDEPVSVLTHLLSDGLGIEVDGRLDGCEICDANGIGVGEGGCCLVDVGRRDNGFELGNGVD